ncbi:DNA polymerase III subunit delta [Actinobacillus equuli]|nr:DNA polymerase III subunit delta [Actinobacillus equuli]
MVEQSAQFSPFQWIDALLDGKIARAERILKHLQMRKFSRLSCYVLFKRTTDAAGNYPLSATSTNSNQPLYMGNLRAEFDRLKVWQIAVLLSSGSATLNV